jgi:hypothetical protein
VPAEHLAPPRLADRGEVLHRELPGALHRLAASRGEEHAVEIARGEIGEPLGEADRRLVAEAPQREVAERAGLLRGRFGQLAAAVPDLHGEQPGQAVEQTVAGLVDDVVAFAAHDDRHRLALETVHVGEVAPQMTAGGGLEIVGIGQCAPQA